MQKADTTNKCCLFQRKEWKLFLSEEKQDVVDGVMHLWHKSVHSPVSRSVKKGSLVPKFSTFSTEVTKSGVAAEMYSQVRNYTFNIFY